MRYVILLLSLNVALFPLAFAEDILILQQKTSFAYEQMKQAEREAKTAEQQIEVKKEQLQYFNQKVVEAEQELEIAYEQSKEANTRMEGARRKWDELSTALSREWEKQKSIR